MASWRAPESAANSKERRVNNALSARRRPPRLAWSEERERKENEPWVLRFRHLCDAERFFFVAATRATAAWSSAKFPCCRRAGIPVVGEKSSARVPTVLASRSR